MIVEEERNTTDRTNRLTIVMTLDRTRRVTEQVEFFRNLYLSGLKHSLYCIDLSMALF